MTRKPKIGSRLLAAARIRAEDMGASSSFSDRLEAEARAPLPAGTRRAAGGELLPSEDFISDALPALLDTLANPDAVGADASRNRFDLLQQAGSLEVAIDAAGTVQARDSLERMLAHQLGTTHVLSMKVAAVMGQMLEGAMVYADPAKKQAACVEVARLAGTVSRLNNSFQAGMLTLQRVRSGGRQVVVVQHNHINEGAQAVVAGTVARGEGRPRQDRGARVNSIDGARAPCPCERLRGAFSAPRRGARRRDGGSCRGPAIASGKCRMHGGASTGPRTPEGLARARRGNWKHGQRSARSMVLRRAIAQAGRDLRAAMRAAEEWLANREG